MEKKWILVTGGCGAVGSNLVNKLSIDQNVIVIDNLTSGNIENINLNDNILIFRNDIRDYEIVENIFSTYTIIKVFHLAANFANQNSVDNPVLDLEVNGIGTLNLLKISNKYGVERFVYTSSSCVYGPNEAEMVENKIGNFDTPYAISKYIGECYCNFFHVNYGLKVVILRLFNSYGPGELWGKYRNVMPNFFNLAILKKPLLITGTGKETRDFTFVADIVEGIIKSSVIGEAVGEIINLGAGSSTTINSLADEINKICSNTGNIEYISRRQWDHVLHRKANTEKASKLLNWKAKTSLGEGVLLYFQWLTKNRK
jgi:UDP-glucose 4-epimerase